jgi:hypothetical protein
VHHLLPATTPWNSNGGKEEEEEEEEDLSLTSKLSNLFENLPYSPFLK